MLWHRDMFSSLLVLVLESNLRARLYLPDVFRLAALSGGADKAEFLAAVRRNYKHLTV